MHAADEDGADDDPDQGGQPAVGNTRQDGAGDRAGGSDGDLVAFDSSLKFTFDTGTGDVTLGVGTGITLATDEAIANARATIQLTVAQSRTIPDGPLTRYEIQRTTDGREEVLLMGNLIGEGGDNPDA